MACLTAYIIYFCTETHYEKCLKKVSRFVHEQNEQVRYFQSYNEIIKPLVVIIVKLPGLGHKLCKSIPGQLRYKFCSVPTLLTRSVPILDQRHHFPNLTYHKDSELRL